VDDDGSFTEVQPEHKEEAANTTIKKNETNSFFKPTGNRLVEVAKEHEPAAIPVPST